MKLLFIDSGLGGLGVMAEVERILSKQNRGGELIFANALTAPGRGYNSMPNFTEKVHVFNHVLERLWDLYLPERIVIACNTLSVVYPETEFAAKRYNSFDEIIETGVDEIIETGVDAVYDAAKGDQQSAFLVLGTPTTALSRVHETALLKRGLHPGRLLSLPCKNLETFIQRDPAGAEARETIASCLQQARKLLPRETKYLTIALCCTHYAFSESVFVQEAHTAGFTPRIVDPNTRLARQVVEKLSSEGTAKSPLSVQVVSGYRLRRDDVANIAALLEQKSPATAAALRGYELRQSLYDPAAGPAL